MFEQISQYFPLIVLGLIAIAGFAMGHYAGTSSVKSGPAADPAADVGLVGNQAEAKKEENVPKVEQSESNPTKKLADELVAKDPENALKVHEALTGALEDAGHLASNPKEAPNADALDAILPAKQEVIGEHAILEMVNPAPEQSRAGQGVVSEQTDSIAKQEAGMPLPPVSSKIASALTSPTEIEVSKAHDALDKAGVFGPNRLIAIAAVRAGQVTGDDVARAHPVAQFTPLAKAAETPAQAE